MNWTDLLTSAIDENYKATDALMAMVTDDDLDWKPATGKNWMTTGQLLMHLTNACGFCIRGFQTGDWGMPEQAEAAAGDSGDAGSMLLPAEALPTVDSVQAARDALAADKQVALAMIAEAGESRMESETTEAPWEPGNQRTYGEHFFGMVLHLQSHKSQLFYYLKLMGKDVNTMNLWGM